MHDALDFSWDRKTCRERDTKNAPTNEVVGNRPNEKDKKYNKNYIDVIELINDISKCSDASLREIGERKHLKCFVQKLARNQTRQQLKSHFNLTYNYFDRPEEEMKNGWEIEWYLIFSNEFHGNRISQQQILSFISPVCALIRIEGDDNELVKIRQQIPHCDDKSHEQNYFNLNLEPNLNPNLKPNLNRKFPSILVAYIMGFLDVQSLFRLSLVSKIFMRGIFHFNVFFDFVKFYRKDNQSREHFQRQIRDGTNSFTFALTIAMHYFNSCSKNVSYDATLNNYFEEIDARNRHQKRILLWKDFIRILSPIDSPARTIDLQRHPPPALHLDENNEISHEQRE